MAGDHEAALVSFMDSYDGRLRGALQWADFDRLWQRLAERADDGWYVYAVGEPVPVAPVARADWLRALDAVAALLRKDHDESYCGIVFADSLDAPTFVKVFDPNNLGASCGSSGVRVLPGWVFSRVPPVHLQPPVALTASRRRWWRALLGG
ncbi:MAG: hypothetical protein ACK4IT_10095 [Thioalkalivibrionaceae bacterium]